MAGSIPKTKIVATLGPASASVQVVTQLIKAGANVFRVNFSHGTYEQHTQTLKTIKQAAQSTGYMPGILADLCGPKIRTGNTPDNKPVMLKKGSRVRVRPGDGVCSSAEIFVSYRKLAQEVAVGCKVLINDGAIRLTVLQVDPVAQALLCRVENNGSFSSHKGVNFPGVELSIPAITAKDRKDLAFILKNDFSIVALSFVQRAADLAPVRAAIKRAKKRVKIIAKIEKPEAIKELDAILDACDGIMVARGDLGVECPPWQVPILQKNLIRAANFKGKMVIVATQMLESMIVNPLPTRAETTDVANAIIDGTDATMLSAETAAGAYPVEAVATMRRIAETTEESPYFPHDIKDLCLGAPRASHAICEAAAWASRDLSNIPAIVFTLSGDTVIYLSKIRYPAPIYAFSPDPQIVSMLALAWNTRAFLLPFESDLVALKRMAERILMEEKCVKNGSQVVVLSGTTPIRGATNMLRVKRIGEE